MTTFPDLARYDRFSVDTETTSEPEIWKRRPVGVSIYTPDKQGWYLRWGHDPSRKYRADGGNNCSLPEFVAWARAELMRPAQLKVFFNAPYDVKMLVYAGIASWPGLFPNFVDAGTSAALLNEDEQSYALDRLCQKYLGEGKDDAELDEWLAAQFGGPTWQQGGNIWRAPGDLVEPYAIQDARLTLALHDRNVEMIGKQGLASVFKLETDIIPVVVNMHFAGVRVARQQAEDVNRGLVAALRDAKVKWAEIAEDAGYAMPPLAEWIVPSTQQIAPVFRKLGVPAVGETALGNDSVTKGSLKAAAEDHPAAQAINDIRELSKQSGTFIESYILSQADADDLVHPEFHPLPRDREDGQRYGTVSGRLSSSLHNLPGSKQPKAGRLLRSLFIPYTPDHLWVKADYSQIEYRFLGHYAGGAIAEAYNRPAEPGLCAACGKQHESVDFHCMLQLMINNPELNRSKIKTVNFAKVFGAGLKHGAEIAGVTVEKWKEIVAAYDAKLPEIKLINTAAMNRANTRGYIVTWGGRRCRFPTVEEMRRRVEGAGKTFRTRPGEIHARTHKALNSLLQGSAADLMKKAMVRVATAGGLVDWRETFLHLTYHDELDFSVPRARLPDFVPALHEAMERWTEADGPKLKVPIRAEVDVGDSWGALVKD